MMVFLHLLTLTTLNPVFIHIYLYIFMVFIAHVVSVERSNTAYNSLHIALRWFNVVSVKRLKKGYNSLHIALHWFHVVIVETVRFTMYILIQSVRITIFFELMFKIHTSSN